MSKGSGTTRTVNSKNAAASWKVGNNMLPYSKQSVNDVKDDLLRYGKIDKWNRNTDYMLGFNDDALSVIETVAKENLGLATMIAQQVTARPGYEKYGASLTDKQAWIIANAAVKSQLVPDKTTFRHYEPKARTKTSAGEKQPLSSTKVKIGSVVVSKHGEGVITRIITKSSGYVETEYNGVKYKEMAFNLNGKDGRPLKNKPNR